MVLIVGGSGIRTVITMEQCVMSSFAYITFVRALTVFNLMDICQTVNPTIQPFYRGDSIADAYLRKTGA